ncbi:MAG TPA: winged helix-turn-helix domain-containing protein [Solirubrobacterales bacterium]|nr:winged helix-turn-helix domain-containing protein [Solirubrobacterales bacterium]
MIQKPKVENRSVDERVAHAIGHPLRIDALSMFHERTASPKEIADEIGVPVGRVAFHVKELHNTGCIELVKTEPRRGAVEHYYRATRQPMLSDEDWRELEDGETRQEIAGLAFKAVVTEGLASLRAGRMDDDDLHLSWQVVNLDAEGRRELAEHQLESLRRTEAIRAASEARLRAAGEEGTAIVAGAFGFERSRGGNRTSGGGNRSAQP